MTAMRKKISLQYTLPEQTVDLISIIEARVQIGDELEELRPLVDRYNALLTKKRDVEEHAMQLIDKINLAANYEGTRLRGGVLSSFLADMFVFLRDRARVVSGAAEPTRPEEPPAD